MQGLLADLGAVLGGEHHCVDGNGLVALVAEGDLALGIRAQPRHGAVLAHLGLACDQAVGVADGGRHQHVGLVGGVAEHQALVAGALLVVFALVHAHGDVRGLLADGVEHGAGLPVEAHVGAAVADVLDHLAGQRLVIDHGMGGDFAGNQHHAGLDQGLAGDAGHGVLGQDGIQYGIGNLIGNLVRMAFGHRFGGKQVAVGHSLSL